MCYFSLSSHFSFNFKLKQQRMTKSDNKDSIYLFYANPILIDNDKLLVRSPFMYIFGNDFHPIMESVASVFQKNF